MGPTTSVSPTGAAAQVEPQGIYVIFHAFAIDDRVATDNQTAQQFISDIQRLPDVGVVRLMDSRRSQRLREPTDEPGQGEYVVLKDGFASYQDATGYCAKVLPALRQSVKGANCYAVPE